MLAPRRRVAITALALAAGLAGVGLPEAAAGAERRTAASGRVAKVVDGDTVVVRIGGQRRTVDLLGIDAPELARKAVRPRKARKGRPGRKGVKARPAQCGALRSRQSLHKFLIDRRGRGRVVRVAVNGRRPVARASNRRERLRPVRATLVRGKQRDAGLEQLRLGWARRVKLRLRLPLGRRYLARQTAAQTVLRGIWGPACVRIASRPAAPVPPAAAAPAPEPACGTLERPIDPRQQTGLGWGRRSNWLQPWRAYLDTRPASDLANGTGIIFDVPFTVARQGARLLAASGVRRARIIVDWSHVERGPGGALRFVDPAQVAAQIEALRDSRLRPMILLNAIPSGPGSGLPTEVPLALRAPAAAGSRTIELVPPLDPFAVVPGRTGFRAYGLQPGIFITALGLDGTATLSRPLDRDLPAGVLGAVTLEFPPFERPRRDNAPNPAFQHTLEGWLQYTDFVTRYVRDTIGSSDFDVEVWNELVYESDFLDANRYHEPDVDIGTGDTNRAILEATLRHIEDPANGLSGIRVGDGFAANDPHPSGATAPPGLAAINKHPYAPLWDVYPGVDDRFPGSPLGAPAVDALGNPDPQDLFAPTFRSHFPEHFLTGMQTDHLVRELSPITTDIDGVPHGRFTRPDDGPPPRVWVSEHTLVPVVPDQTANQYLQAKIVLRSLIAYVGAGAELVALYSATDKDFGMIWPDFFRQVRESGGQYPGDDAGGRTMTALRRLSEAIGGGTAPDRITPLELRSISDCHNHAIFEGDGTAAHPTLHHRDALAFFPFQTSDRRYVIPYWVMTREAAKVWRPERPESDLSRYDFPPEKYVVKLGGLGGREVRAGALDPISGETVPASVVARDGDTVSVEIEATDSPRLLVLED